MAWGEGWAGRDQQMLVALSGMQQSDRRVVVAMSGGVDSSVAALLLREQGYEVVGLFMRVGASGGRSAATALPVHPRHQGCCSADDAADARRVAGRLGIPFYALNFAEAFEGIIDYFASEYERGRTPNPCIRCNTELKFGRLLRYADAIGARWVATGHYARIEHRDGRATLRRGADPRKDQSYVLFGLKAEALRRTLLPLGVLTKQQVRRIAAEHDLPVSAKPESAEICFVPDRDYVRVVRSRRPEAFRPGPIVTVEGKEVGRHEGVAGFTVGQRRGLRVALGEPVYVTRIDAAANTVVVGPEEALLARSFVVEEVNWLVPPAGGALRADVQIRYHHRAAPAVVEPRRDAIAVVTFDEPQRAITPGQAAVFYKGDVVLGGGWIGCVSS